MAISSLTFDRVKVQRLSELAERIQVMNSYVK